MTNVYTQLYNLAKYIKETQSDLIRYKSSYFANAIISISIKLSLLFEVHDLNKFLSFRLHTSVLELQCFGMV